MREQVEEIIRKSYSDVHVWEYTETRHYVYVRFSAVEGLYMGTMYKSAMVMDYFKHEKGVELNGR